MADDSLLIAVRFHEGRYHGQEDGFNGGDGWPPSPARLFQALVAGAARGARLLADDERSLKWLERLDPPAVAAPPGRRGRSVKLFVPNNDLDSVGGDPARVGEIRVGKPWRPWFFNPDESILYLWDFESGSVDAEQICSISSRLYQLGRGIDMAWACGRILDRDSAKELLQSYPGPLRTPNGTGNTATPCPGTLDSLDDRYRRTRTRLRTEGAGRKARQLFTQPPKALFGRTGYDLPSRFLHFELRGPKDRFAPRPLASAAALVAGLRDAAADRLRNSLPAKAATFERLIVGRGAGARDVAQRIRIVPIPSIGTQHTDPSIRRIMIEIPPECPIRVDDLKWAFAGLRPHDPQTGEVWTGSLVSTEDSPMASRYLRSAQVFRSVTPVAMPAVQRRRLGMAEEKTAGERSEEEARAAGAVVQALRHAGLRTRPSDIRVQREPFQRRGIRVESFAAGSRFSKLALWHVELRFRERISGPLVIGDGRFCGLGLMEPVVDRKGVVGFDLGRSTTPEESHSLVGHLRRALMALARDDAGRIGRLFSGHESDGGADRNGPHAHIFLAADDDADDGGSTRLVVVAPWIMDRKTSPQHGDRRLFDEVTQQLTELNAGRVGRFDRLVREFVEDGDPLVGPATKWIGKTPYVATRNLKKRDDPAVIITKDIAAECGRRGLPTPTDICVSDIVVGPRGGRPRATIALEFATAIVGPLFLGRDSHSGGGLFHAVMLEPK